MGHHPETWQGQPHGYEVLGRENRYDPVLERVAYRDVEKHREYDWRATSVTC